MAAVDAIKRKRLLLGLAGLALACCLALAFLYYFGLREEPSSRDETPRVQAVMHGVTLLHGEKGSRLWRLQAPRAEVGRDRELVTLSQPQIEYSFEGNKTLVASSEKGKYNRSNRTAVFWSGVSGKYGQVRFTAGRMVYTAEKGTVRLLRGVHVTRGSAFIRSAEASFDLDTQRVVFSRDAEVELYADQS